MDGSDYGGLMTDTDKNTLRLMHDLASRMVGQAVAAQGAESALEAAEHLRLMNDLVGRLTQEATPQLEAVPVEAAE